MNRRIIFSDNGSLADFTTELNSYHSGIASFTYTANEDYLYISSDLPFNHLKVHLGDVANVETAVMAIECWDGNSWEEVAEVVDETEAFSKEGFVTFVPSKESSWVMDDTNKSNGSNIIDGLGDVVIYDKYWIRISFNATLTIGTELSWLGQIFSEDEALIDEFPEFSLSAVKSAFESGKTTWEDQHYSAAKVIIKDLVGKRMIHDGAQILCKEDIEMAAVQKVAQIIFGALGDDYVDQREEAKKEYNLRINSAFPKIDTNDNGRLDPHERRPSYARMYR